MNNHDVCFAKRYMYKSFILIIKKYTFLPIQAWPNKIASDVTPQNRGVSSGAILFADMNVIEKMK